MLVSVYEIAMPVAATQACCAGNSTPEMGLTSAMQFSKMWPILFFFFKLNEQFFKFYSALQFLKVSHT